MPDARRWYDESTPSALMREGFARAHLLKLAEVIRQSYSQEIRQPPLGFLFKKNGAVTMVPDLFAVPKDTWPHYLGRLSLAQKADYFVIVCEGSLVRANAEQARSIVDQETAIMDIEGAREGVLIVLSTGDVEMRQMLFLPHTAEGLGEVEVATDAEEEDNN